MQVYEGAIVSCDAKRGVYRYLAEDRGRILFVGDALPPEYERAPRTGLGERCILPAFADTHIHFMSYALFSAGLDIRDARSIAEAKQMIAERARVDRSPIVLGFGASAHRVAEGRLLAREDLDAACPDTPAFIVKYDGHAGIANSALIALQNQAARSSRGFDAETGLMTQEAFFRVTDYVTGKVSLPETLGNMLTAMDRLASLGIGTLHSVTGVGFPLDLDVTLESLFARGLRDEVHYRVFFQTMDVGKARRRRLPRIGGCFATALDGCFGSADAAMLEPYAEAAGLAPEAVRGILYYPDEKVRAFCLAANRAGLQIEMHAIGDAAFEQAVSALAAALDDHPRPDHRHTIIHACLPTERGLAACAELGISLAVQPAFLHWEQEPLSYLEDVMGGRALRLQPLKAISDMGIVMAGGSDAPCTVPDPLYGIWAACNHYVPGQSLGIQEAIDLYTRNAAYVGFDDGERGSLEAGKAADLVILNRNPLELRPSDLRLLKAESLILSGKAYRGKQGRADLVKRGLANGGARI